MKLLPLPFLNYEYIDADAAAADAEDAAAVAGVDASQGVEGMGDDLPPTVDGDKEGQAIKDKITKLDDDAAEMNMLNKDGKFEKSTDVDPPPEVVKAQGQIKTFLVETLGPKGLDVFQDNPNLDVTDPQTLAKNIDKAKCKEAFKKIFKEDPPEIAGEGKGKEGEDSPVDPAAEAISKSKPEGSKQEKPPGFDGSKDDWMDLKTMMGLLTSGLSIWGLAEKLAKEKSGCWWSSKSDGARTKLPGCSGHNSLKRDCNCLQETGQEGLAALGKHDCKVTTSPWPSRTCSIKDQADGRYFFVWVSQWQEFTRLAKHAADYITNPMKGPLEVWAWIKNHAWIIGLILVGIVLVAFVLPMMKEVKNATSG